MKSKKDKLKKFEEEYGTQVSTGVSSILNPPDVKEALRSHVLKGTPLRFDISTLYGTKLTDDPAYLASTLREMLSQDIASRLSKMDVKSEDILPLNEKVVISDLPIEEILQGTRGKYSPVTGNIQLDFNRPEKDIMATYAHELAHKAEGQSVGYEGKKTVSGPRAVLYGNQKEEVSQPPIVEGPITNKRPISAKSLINYYYGKHHRADAKNAWEIEALRNLEAGKPIREPMTRDLSPEYKEAIQKAMNRKKK